MCDETVQSRRTLGEALSDAPYPEKHGVCEDYKPSPELGNLPYSRPEKNKHQLIHELFSYHPWNEEQQRQGAQVRDVLAHAYATILEVVPEGPARSRALQGLQDIRMMANQAITFKGVV